MSAPLPKSLAVFSIVPKGDTTAYRLRFGAEATTWLGLIKAAPYNVRWHPEDGELLFRASSGSRGEVRVQEHYKPEALQPSTLFELKRVFSHLAHQGLSVPPHGSRLRVTRNGSRSFRVLMEEENFHPIRERIALGSSRLDRVEGRICCTYRDFLKKEAKKSGRSQTAVLEAAITEYAAALGYRLQEPTSGIKGPWPNGTHRLQDIAGYHVLVTKEHRHAWRALTKSGKTFRATTLEKLHKLVHTRAKAHWKKRNLL